MNRRADLTRQLAVTICFIAGMVGTLAGLGIIGTRVSSSSRGALSADATLLTPATTAFSIWTVIYIGLVGYLIWQWLPANASADVARDTGWWAAASLLLNGAWLGVTQLGWLWVSVLVIALLAFVLGKLCLTLVGRKPASVFELLVVQVTFGLYLGWVCVATVANVTAAAVGTGIQLGGAEPIVAIVVLLVAGGLGVYLSRALPGQPAIGVAMAWGLAWIAVGRLVAEPQALLVGAVAAVCAAGVLGAHLPHARRGSPANAQRSP